jgi:hypothetical protein
MKVVDKVCRLSNHGWVEGKVVEITEKGTDRQKSMVAMYLLEFDNAPTTRVDRDFEATGESVHFYQQKSLGLEQITMTNYKVLGIVGVNILTK